MSGGAWEVSEETSQREGQVPAVFVPGKYVCLGSQIQMGLLLQGNCFSYAIQERGRFVFVSLFSICEYVDAEG